MVKNLRTEQVEEFSKRRQQKLWIKRGFMVLAVVVMFMTVYGLVLPAVTMEHPDPACGLEEHKHTEACMERQLTCELPEEAVHVHSQACFDEETGELDCDVEPAAGHMHIDACFATGDELICENTEEGHTHGEDCYAEEGALLCEVEETAHMHRVDCFDAADELTCESKAAHIHGFTCYKLKDAAEDEEQNSSDVILSGAQSAESKDLGDPNAVDAPEAQENDQSEPESTAPQAQEGDQSEPEEPAAPEAQSDSQQDAIADNPTPSVDLAAPSAAIADQYVLACEEEDAGHVHFAFCFDEEGELVCELEEKVMVEHEHGDDCYGDVAVCGIEEHSHDEVCFDAESFQMIQASKDHSAELAEQEAAEAAKAEGQTPEAVDDAELAALKEKGLAYENENMVMVFQVPEEVEGEVRFTVTEGDEPEQSTQDVILSGAQSAESKDLDDPDNATAPQAQSDSQPTDETPAWENNLHIEATIDGEPVEDIASLGATVQFQVKEEAVKPILDEINYEEVAEEIKDEVGAEITITQIPTNPEDYAISERPKEQSESFVVASASPMAYSATLASANLHAAAARTADPTFTVSYYANVEMVNLTDSKPSGDSLYVMDTAGGKLPTNQTVKNDTVAKKYVPLSYDSSGYKVTAVQAPTEVYTPKTCNYVNEPNLSYFNKLYENDHYELREVKVKQPGQASYTSYDPEKIHFTNREASASKPGYVLITDGTDIQLMYAITTGRHAVDTKFYDYDITDGKIYTSADNANNQKSGQKTSSQTANGDWYANTRKQGINSVGNYKDKNGNDLKGAKYAFGNSNAGTGLGDEAVGGFKINAGNSATSTVFQKCAYGLVKGIDFETDSVVFADGIAGPAIFGNTGLVGKTTYDGHSINYKRSGDTYEIYQVKQGDNVVLNNLDVFSHESTIWNMSFHQYANDFWALDHVSSFGGDGHDLKFGAQNKLDKRHGTGCTLPVVDDYRDKAGNKLSTDKHNKDHNSYFGMMSQVDFALVQDYCGPLDYFFFGDDDMWVFLLKLNDDGSVNTSVAPKLVCDIGGVHQTTGEYVNLWDHIAKGSEGKYALRFYYTERGASGSTCYMRFTLPSVSNSTMEQDTGNIQVEKNVVAPADYENADEDEFEFSIRLMDAAGNNLPDDYSYTRYAEDGTKISSDLIIHDGGSFRLRDGEYVVIKYLPFGTKYVVEEKGVVNSDGETLTSLEDFGYRPSWEFLVNGKADGTSVSNKYEGVVADNGTTTIRRVVYTNTIPYEMPATGGFGTEAFLLVGGVLLLTGLGWQVRRRYQAAVHK